MLKVENDYYSLVAEDYLSEIAKIESSLESFKALCDALYAVNNFGSCLQEVMQEMYINFYEASKEKLNTLWTQAQSIQEEFTTNIVDHDKM